MNKKCVILLSGGIDSAVLLYSLIAEYECYPLTIGYGQRHNKEVISARNICEARGDWLLKRWRYLDLSNLRFILPSALTNTSIEVPKGVYTAERMSQTVVPNRNMIFLAIAAGYAEGIGAEHVAYAAHTEDHYLYPDTTPSFAIACGTAIQRGTGDKVKTLFPFIDKTKADIVALGKKLVVPFKLTWSCYAGDDLHCGECSTCLERMKAFKKVKVKDPTMYANRQLTMEEPSAKEQELEPVLRYKEFYNEGRGLPEPKWGSKAEGLQCPNCGSWDMYYSGSPDDPEEILSGETVRCGHCGCITDWYEARKQREHHHAEEVKVVIK